MSSRGKFNNDSIIVGSIGANEPFFGLIRFGKNSFMPDGTSVSAERVNVGSGTSIYQVNTTSLSQGSDATIRNGVGPVTLPLVNPFCSLPPIECNDDDVFVDGGQNLALPAGTYGNLVMRNGAMLELSDPDGEYTFCKVKVARNAHIMGFGRPTINVAGTFAFGAGSSLTTDGNLPVILNVAGRKVRISQSAVVYAAITAPNAKLKIQRDGALFGCYCTDNSTTDKNVSLVCVDTASPSGAFVD